MNDKKVNIKPKDVLKEYAKNNSAVIYKSIIVLCFFAIAMLSIKYTNLKTYLDKFEYEIQQEESKEQTQALSELAPSNVIDKSIIDESALKSITETNGKFTGERKDGKKNGLGKYEWNSGAVYEGYFKDDNIDGKGKLTIPEKGVYDGNFSNNKRNGQGTFTFVNGDVYVGTWKDDVMSGKGKYTFNNGDYYDGYFENNMFNGAGTYYTGGNIYTGRWTNNAYNK